MLRTISILFLSVTVASTAFAADSLLRDPTQPPDVQQLVASVVGKDGLIVSSITYGKTRKHAVVNGKAVVVGDKIGNVTVVSIMPDAVRFRDASEEFEVPLLKSEIKSFKSQKE